MKRRCSIYVTLYAHLIYGIEFWGHAPEYLISKLLISQKKALSVVVKQPLNSHISYKFNDLKIMPISMLFKFRLVIFYNRDVLSIKDNCISTKKDHRMVTTKNLENYIKAIKIKSKKEHGQCFSLLLTSTVSLFGTFVTSPVGFSGNSWWLACGSWTGLSLL